MPIDGAPLTGSAFSRIGARTTRSPAPATTQRCVCSRSRPPCSNNRGYSRFLQGDLPGAEADLRAAIQLDASARALVNLGKVQAKGRRYGDAFKTFLETYDAAHAYNAVGESAMKNGDNQIARTYFEQAAGASPSYYEEAEKISPSCVRPLRAAARPAAPEPERNTYHERRYRLYSVCASQQHTPKWIMSVLRAAGTALVAGFFTLLFISCIRVFLQTHAPDALGLVIVNGLFVILYVTRSDPRSVSISPSEWTLSFAGTTLPMFMRPTSGGFEGLGLAIQFVGLIVIVAALLSLRRSFGVVPANRGVRQGGFYRWVRHPLYAGEMVFITGFVLVNPSILNIGLWAADCLLQVCRARCEERFLSADPQYRCYRQRSRYRLLPLIY